jgi:hypothetical protein
MKHLLYHISDAWHLLINGVRNLFNWLPVIWYDSDIDYWYFLALLKHKLKNMANYFEKYGHAADSDKYATEIRQCIAYIDAIYLGEGEQENIDKLCDTIKQNLTEWWD